MEGLVTSEREATRAAPPPSPAHDRRWRLLGWASIVLSALMVLASLTAYGFYRSVNGAIERDNIDDQLAADRPEKLNNSLNILLLGSDSREGDNKRFGSDQGGGSDTTILMHISPGGERAIGISFPRDSMVQIPECKKKDGTRVPSQFGQLNWAYSFAGPACTWNLIESLTDIRIDHYAEIDMSGFIEVVDALGGVEICVPKPIRDPKADLVLKKGRQVVMGKQAIGYVRTRTGGLGDGSDLSRIKRQQAFMGSVVKKATSSGLLKDPARTYAFLQAVAKAVKVDDRLTLGTMQKLAASLRGLSAGKVTFVTVPVTAYPADKNRVQIDMARAKPLFDAIREDNELPPEEPKQPARQNGGQPPAKPAETKVAVYNGTTTDGLGQRTADGLTEQGFQIVKVGTKQQSADIPTRILYGPGAERQAAALAAKLQAAPQPTAFPSGRPGLVYLIIGKDGVRLRGTGTPLPKIAGERRADQDVCSQTT
ncbi:LCP family protein [Thermomonospora sp. CIF 1]|uniref:LCP family protein n=1 Tax=Thermomonospora sp. CIF 1 TaxID=1916083 RepID=UPI000B0A4819|nr:LCP family protein [Thermomonospora sp. CIF 1]PKK15650.1 MAG: transcriptional regulator [Thermomonospora sp. CIF 1]